MAVFLSVLCHWFQLKSQADRQAVRQHATLAIYKQKYKNYLAHVCSRYKHRNSSIPFHSIQLTHYLQGYRLSKLLQFPEKHKHSYNKITNKQQQKTTKQNYRLNCSCMKNRFSPLTLVCTTAACTAIPILITYYHRLLPLPLSLCSN